MFRRHLQLAGNMMFDQFLHITCAMLLIAEKQIVSNTGCYKYFFDASDLAQSFEQINLAAVIRPQGRTYLRIKTSLVLAGALSLLAPTINAIHIRRGTAGIQNVTFKIRQLSNFLRLVNY